MNSLLPAAALAQPSPVKLAIDATWAVLTARLKNLRRFALCALGFGAAVLLAALIGRSFIWLWGLAGLPLLGFAYIRRERHLVNGWENHVLDLWAAGDMYLSVVAQTLAMQPGPMKSSLQPMLDLLPVESRSETVPRSGKSLRRALAAVRHGRESSLATRGACLYVGAIGAMFGAWMAWSASIPQGAAAATAVLAVCAAAWAFSAVRRRRRLRRRLARFRGDAPWSAAEIEAALAGTSGSSISSRDRTLLREGL